MIIFQSQVPPDFAQQEIFFQMLDASNLPRTGLTLSTMASGTTLAKPGSTSFGSIANGSSTYFRELSDGWYAYQPGGADIDTLGTNLLKVNMGSGRVMIFPFDVIPGPPEETVPANPQG